MIAFDRAYLGSSLGTSNRTRETWKRRLEEFVSLPEVALVAVGNRVVDRLDRAYGLARTAFRALCRMDPQATLRFVDAIDRANVDASLILASNTGVIDYVGHYAASLVLWPGRTDRFG